MSKVEIRKEAQARQGTVIQTRDRSFLVGGNPDFVHYMGGAEGLVHRAIDLSNGAPCCLKCFYEPTDIRQKRSEALVRQQLANLKKSIGDALGGAPYQMLTDLSMYTPFAIVMKNVNGKSWHDLKDAGKAGTQYPFPGWPPLAVRATWAFGLATAVARMEQQNFIHADLSAGNVMVTPDGPNAGDMALVDFDAFVHPQHPQLDTVCRGSEGYAAPEIWERQSASLGSDRVGMAILIQEFLIAGEKELSRDEAFGWAYGQDEDICARRGEAHPYVVDRYPEIAALVECTLSARIPAHRPEPERWREALRRVIKGEPPRRKLVNVALHSHPIAATCPPIPVADPLNKLDLSLTVFRVRATLERNRNGSIDLIVHPGATVHLQSRGKHWAEHAGGSRVPLTPGIICFDEKGKSGFRLDGTEA